MKNRIKNDVARLIALVAIACGVDWAVMAQDIAMERARARLSKLTLDEKVLLAAGSGSMSMRVPGTDREWQFSDNSQTVRPNMERWTWDCIQKDDESTVLPTLSSLAATWSKELAAKFGHVMGEEARARGKDMMLGPGVNIMRNPLCGRTWEYFSEDPCLTSKLVVPEIMAMQSHDVAACVKHFCLNNQELNRNAVDTICDERTLNEIYLPAFEAAVKDAGVWSLMTAYNKVNGDWASENAYLQRGILRDRWGYKGLIVTDWGGQHSTVKAALNGAGVEMNRGADIRYFVNPKEGKAPLAEAVRKGEVPESVVDEIALHSLWTLEKANFFNPEQRDKGERNTPAHQTAAREIAEEAIVLFKNDDGVLPLAAGKMKKIVVVGKLADTEMTKKGWSAEGKPLYEITPLMGLNEYFSKSPNAPKIVRLPLVASDSTASVHDVIESSVGTFDTSALDAGMSVRAWQVSYFNNTKSTDGKPFKTGFARTVGFDAGNGVPAEGLNPSNFAVLWKTKLLAPEAGDYTLSVTMDHRGGTVLTLDGKVLANASECDSVTTQVRLEAGKEYDFSVAYLGDTGEHRMKFGWALPSESGKLEDIRREAADADAVLVFTGTEVGHGQALECEGADRPNMKLPKGHDEAISKILEWDIPNLVIVTHSGAPLELPWADKARTIIHEPFIGQEAGRAFARVLFGDVCASGKLPCTWAKCYEDTGVAQMGSYTANRSVYNEGIFVGYRWHDAKEIAPCFPFGHGLSYTTFKYGEAKVEKTGEASFVVRVPVTNTGKVTGKEAVQLYVAPVDAKVVRPPKELKDFSKVALAPGETKTVELRLKARDFAYWDVGVHNWRVDAGKYRLLVGSSSADIRAESEVVLD